MNEDDFEVRMGRMRARPSGGPKTFVGQALAAAQRAGGLARRPAARSGTFGRGRAASLRALHAAPVGRSRGAVVKARIVRAGGGRAPLATHLQYLMREGVTQEGDRGQLFDAQVDAADGEAFAERCQSDRHHFRFIVSPDDADQLSDLKGFTRDLMRQAEADLGTRLDWVGVDHWNTGHPHIHVLVRGRTDRDADLVISRDYIKEGLRARAGALVTLELGPRSEREIRQLVESQVEVDRWTPLDRGLARMTDEQGLIDLRQGVGDEPLRSAQVRRLRKLERLGLAHERAPGRWRLDPQAEPTLRELGQRQDIIARMHRAMAAETGELDPTRLVLMGGGEEAVAGRLVARGLDDELKGTAYAVVEAFDGRVHHVGLADLDHASDARPGALVEVRHQIWEGRRGRVVLQVRSDLDLAGQVKAHGATWLDRQLVGSRPVDLGEGRFPDEVRSALAARAEHLAGEGLAQRNGRRWIFARDLLETLRERELAAASADLQTKTGLVRQPLAPEGAVGGVYSRRLDLASGRFAMLEDGLGFTLVPWRPAMERHLGRHIEGQLRFGQGIAWSFTPQRGVSR